MGDTTVRQLVVVVPACNEEDTVGAAVGAVLAAATALPDDIAVDVVVVVNGCSDDTAERARAAGAQVLEGDTPNVGAARALGHAWALGRVDDLTTLWVASTDADSTVPVGWLTAQVQAAHDGADVFLGTIGLAPADAGSHATWLRRYVTRDAAQVHGHVHGASLGTRGSAYARVGGFRELHLHEDVDLVTRLVAAGAVPAWVEHVPVTTSARHSARVVGGVSADLAASEQVAPERADPPSSVA